MGRLPPVDAIRNTRCSPTRPTTKSTTLATGLASLAIVLIILVVVAANRERLTQLVARTPSDDLAAVDDEVLEGLLERQQLRLTIDDVRCDVAKVADFGLAKLRADASLEGETVAATEGITGEGRVLGTVPYMSPEHIQGKAVDQRSDVFSLGLVLHELFTGHRVYDADTVAELRERHLHRHVVGLLGHQLHQHRFGVGVAPVFSA